LKVTYVCCFALTLPLDEVENVYVILQQIHSGNFVPNC